MLVTSAPAGAEILVDGEPTGFTTPHMLDLGGFFGGDHVLTLRKRGYVDENRTVYHYTTFYTSKWIDGASDIILWPVPLWWTTGDLLFPFAARWVYVPHELYVRLYTEGEAPVTAGDTVDVK